MKKIFLTQRRGSPRTTIYFVKRLVNDAQYKIGQRLTHAEVLDLCDRPAIWTVTITKD